MKPYDKFGNKLYPKTYIEIANIGRKLQILGYKEHERKPNLFFIKHHTGTFYADLRGTGMVPIWEDTRALFYWRLKKNLPVKQRQKIAFIEWMRTGDIPKRFSNDMAGDYDGMIPEAQLINIVECDPVFDSQDKKPLYIL